MPPRASETPHTSFPSPGYSLLAHSNGSKARETTPNTRPQHSDWPMQVPANSSGQLLGSSMSQPSSSTFAQNGSSHTHHHQQTSSSTLAPNNFSHPHHQYTSMGSSQETRPLHLQAQTGMPAVSTSPFNQGVALSYPLSLRPDAESSLAQDSRLGAMQLAPMSDSQAGPSRTLGFAATSSSMKRPVHQFILPQDQTPHIRRRRRPPYSYAGLIAQAINSAPDGRLTLREVYQKISSQYPTLYPMTGIESAGWQNTVRHNLSLNKAFKRQARTARDPPETSGPQGKGKSGSGRRGKGGFWILDPVRGAALLNATTRGEDADDSPERDRSNEGGIGGRERHDSATPRSPGAAGASRRGGPSAITATMTGTGTYPSVLLPRVRSDSPKENETMARSLSASASGLFQPSSVPSSFYQMALPSLPSTPQTAPLQHPVYPSIPLEPSGRTRGYTVGTMDHAREQSWFSTTIAAQSTPASLPGSSYGLNYPAEGGAGGSSTSTGTFANSNVFDQRGMERYGMRARHQTSTGIPTSAGTSFSSAGLHPGSAVSLPYPLNFQQRSAPQWSMTASSSSSVPTSQSFAASSLASMGASQGVTGQGAAGSTGRAGDFAAARGGTLRGFEGPASVLSGAGTRTTLSTNILSSSGDTPAMQFPPASNPAYSGVQYGTAGPDGGNAVQQQQQQQQQQHQRQQHQHQQHQQQHQHQHQHQHHQAPHHHLGMFAAQEDEHSGSSRAPDARGGMNDWHGGRGFHVSGTAGGPNVTGMLSTSHGPQLNANGVTNWYTSSPMSGPAPLPGFGGDSALGLKHARHLTAPAMSMSRSLK
ncbi:hypothetical protein A4X13_0g3314 [Tilletia indica]|uniref:Uncharacterized protein n=1 Tax=Tilletia indica TaxID=43049 RepID=A0A177TAL7_9BASI|nr:hypothetical protein A4X13_0g3314 [Tilletia indica]